jgi:RNA polymerase sigma factor (sigma-70 family)
MPGQLHEVVRGLRGLLGQTDPAVSDAALLGRFVSEQDESAFATLVRRHGPLVLGVCRRVLKNPHDADDAFQAVFLVLVRKAASIRRPGALANWLFGVSYRTALVVKRSAMRRRSKEAMVAPRKESNPDQDELLGVLDEELASLPEKYREAVVLCDLQGKTRKEAAHQLNCREGTVASRLGRGRELLAQRLARKGFALSVGALAVILSQASASVPASLIVGTVKSAAVSTVASATIAALTEKVMKVMLLNKLKTLGAAVVLAGVLATASVVGVAKAPADEVSKPSVQKPKDNKDDEEFIKRACLDIRGTLPTAIEVAYFLTDTNPRKRAWLVAKLREEASDKEKQALTRDRVTVFLARLELLEKAKEQDTGPLLFGAGRKKKTLPLTYADHAKAEVMMEAVQMAVDLERLQGTWVVISYKRDGKEVPGKVRRGLKLVFDRDLLSSYEGGSLVERNLFLLQPGKTRVMKLTQVTGGEPLQTRRAIYKFQNGRLRLCANRTGAVPTEFGKGPGIELFELRRIEKQKVE